ncbi:hypothetical protein ColTof4_11884 [Colletotrichum tofieldiae]|nr:hypothetical protein ColTof3_03043 [Colletotrichum tofieldiae]GKT79461.1 hypothetical protein ColTof4_11884 [Colletotrichum tofieldiae]
MSISTATSWKVSGFTYPTISAQSLSIPALATVTRLVDSVQQTGVLDLQGAWRRIQDGYVWSKIVGSRETVPGDFRDIGENGLRIDILRLQTNVSQKLHCTSRVNIGRHKLVDWLAPSVWGTSSGDRGGNPHDFLKG